MKDEEERKRERRKGKERGGKRRNYRGKPCALTP